MRLSKLEHKYRVKFIQEHNLNKNEQSIFEKAKMSSGRTYKDIYKSYRKGEVSPFMLTICGGRISKATRQVGLSATEVTEMILKLNQIPEMVVNLHQAIRKVDYTLEI